MQEAPLVSVITPTRNRPNLLREAWRSLRDQTLQDFEYVISVNGKGASSLGEAHRIRRDDEAAQGRIRREGRVKVLYAATSNYYEAIHAGLKACRAGLVHFLSDDDILEPQFLATCCERFSRDPDLELVGVDYRAFLDPGGTVLEIPCMLENPTVKGTKSRAPALGAFVINTSVFRTSLLKRMTVGEGPFDTSFRILGDEHFFVRLSKTAAKAEHICLPLMRYRVHTAQVTQKQEIRHFFEKMRIRKAMEMSESLPSLVSRLAWSANRMTGYLGTRAKRNLGIKVDHDVLAIDRLRYPALRGDGKSVRK